MNRTAIASFTVLAVTFGGSSSFGLSFEPDGTVSGWDVKPFSSMVGSPGTETHANGVFSLYNTDYSPISYPGIGNVPSPGGGIGKRFDLQEMHVRQNGSLVEMLLVRNSAFEATAHGQSFTLGDLLLDTTGDGSFDHGVVSTSINGLTAGGFYSIDETARLQNKTGSYYGHALEAEIGPWAIASGTLLGQNDLVTDSATYAGQGLTWLTVYSFDLLWLSEAPESIDFHMVWGCGNDKLAGTFSVASFSSQDPSDPLPNQDAAIPEPATALMALIGLAGGGIAGLRRRR